MPTPFIMPKFDMDQEQATVVELLKKDGDFVKLDEAVLVVETDKVAIEVPSPAAGRLAGLRLRPGDVVPVTTVIAQILAEGESAQDLSAAPIPLTAQVPLPPAVAPAHGLPRAVAGAVPSAPGGKIPATPVARRLARELQVSLAAIQGSGPRGRIQAKDVMAAAQQVQAVPAVPPTPAASGERPAELVPLAGMRATIASRMQASFHDVPHISLTVAADVSALEAARTRMNQLAGQHAQPKVSITALLVRLVAWALERHPLVNASLIEDTIHCWHEVNIGVATAIDAGLIVPVVRDANRKTVSQINAELKDLSERARQSRLALSEVKNGTFTISNLGMFGIQHFRAIINPPESAILAVGKVTRQPVVINERDELAVRPMMNLTLSADHRVIDGVVAARFLADLVQAIENPDLTLY